MQVQTPTVTLTPSQHNGYNITCFGKTDGSITANVTGGMPPYTYAWTNDQTTQTINNLAAGYYSVRVTDAALHEVDADITLTEPELLELQAAVFTYPNGYNVSLYNAYNGSITVTVNGGVANYNLLWNDGNTSQNRNTLGASSFMVTVTDANGCQTNSERLILTQPERSDWTMTGNANTNPTIQFIGTTDNKDLVFKTNNLERLQITNDGKIKIKNLESANVGLDLLFVDENGILKIGPKNCNTVLNTPWLNGGNYFTPNASTNQKQIGTCTNHEFVFISNAIERARFTPLGRFGIGTIAPQSFVSIAGELAIGTNYAGLTQAPVNGLIVEGNVGIGTSTVDPNTQLTISSTNDALACIGTTNAAGANVGLLLKSGPNGWYSFKVNAAGLGSITAEPGTNIITYNMNGNVGIGTSPQDGVSPYKLVVEGKIGAREINVKATGAWPDYVFEEDYKLMPLPQLKKYIELNNHLPQLPSATTIEKDGGYDLGKMQQLHLMKIEELYLYVFELMKRVEELENQIKK